MTDLTQKTDSIERKSSDKPHPIRRKRRPSSSRKPKSDFNPNRFYWLYSSSDLGPDERILTSGVRCHAKAKTIQQAKGSIRASVRSHCGNAALNLKIDKGDSLWINGVYEAPEYEVTAIASLVVPRGLDQKKKNQLRKRFDTANAEYDFQTESSQAKEGENNIPLPLLLFVGIVLVLMLVVGPLLS